MSRKIRVLYVSHFDHYRMGGQKSMLALIENLDREKVTPLAVVPRKGPLSKKLEELNCKVIFIPLTKLSPNNLFKIIKNLFRIRKVYKKENIDIVHPDYERDGLLFGVAKIFTKVKMTWHVRLTRENNHDKFNARLADKLICISEGAKSRFDSLHVSTDKFEIVYNGVDTSLFKPVEEKTHLRKKLNIPIDKFIVIFVGQIKKGKGVFDLLKAAKMLDDSYHFIFLGKYENEKIEEKWKKKTAGNSNISSPGQQSNIHEWMQAADALVLPSHEGNEGMGRVMFEAMACGIPALGSDISGVREAVDENSGLLFPEKSPEELANTIKRLKEESGLYLMLSRGARKRAVEVFDIKIHAQKITEVYEGLENRNQEKNIR